MIITFNWNYQTAEDNQVAVQISQTFDEDLRD